MALPSETVDTRFTRLVGCRLPFQLAALGGVGTTELAAAVSAGGGLGMVPYGVEPPVDDGGHWPGAARVLGGSLIRARRSGNRSTMAPTRQADDPLAMACYAGMSVPHLTRIQPAADVLRDLASQLR